MRRESALGLAQAVGHRAMGDSDRLRGLRLRLGVGQLGPINTPSFFDFTLQNSVQVLVYL